MAFQNDAIGTASSQGQLHQDLKGQAGMVVHACNPSTQKAEAGSLRPDSHFFGGTVSKKCEQKSRRMFSFS
jgi:hypothetical protein